MNKHMAIDQVYRIATLTEPTEEIRSLLGDLAFDRVLELLLMLRQSPGKVRHPEGFLRRAILEDWQPGQIPQKLDRRTENAEERYYMRRGYSPEQARQAVQEGRQKGWGV
ncbi:hypothetical protein [Paenibacillus durus]|uniref:hypothetical protein n=1 Tax=Paenibacillus durus TaxID=44251 RepID=UPI00069505EF|nr:hypothetical protein [Paenibacillus durus]